MQLKSFCLTSSLVLLLGAPTFTQAQDTPPASQSQEQPPPSGGNRGPGRGGQMEGHGTIGKITAITGNSIELAKPDGTSITVKLSGQTEFRKDRQPAKLGDFKVGDFVMVRGDENADHSVNAVMVGGRTGGGAPGGGFGEMGKDYVAGEVKSIDAPSITVLRSDNVTQTIELTEDTSLRKGRDSITMADIHAGDHIVMRGALQNNVFVPKNVMILSPEQWERMQQMGRGNAGPGGSAPAGAPANNPPKP